MRQIDKHLATFASAALLVAALGCAHDRATDETAPAPVQKTSTSTAPDVHASAAEIRDHAFDRSGTVKFQKGSADLTEADKTFIRQFVDRARSQGDIDKIEVAVWSDKAFPANGKELPSYDKDLADKRADNIENFLKDDLKLSSISTFNMAETSNWLARMFRTDQFELKSVFAKQENVPLSREDFDLIRKQGAPSKAVIVLSPKVAKTGQSNWNY